ncbi:MAG: helix-turn-helix domain-containing protein, partial [Planctomycetota bacterium]
VSDDEISAEQLKLSSEGIGTSVSDDLPLTEATRQFQADYIEQQIQRAAGNMTEAAKRLGLHRSNLYRKMGQLGMSEPDDE